MNLIELKQYHLIQNDEVLLKIIDFSNQIKKKTLFKPFCGSQDKSSLLSFVILFSIITKGTRISRLGRLEVAII